MKLKNKPYDLDSWETLIKEAQVRGIHTTTLCYCDHLQTSALIRGRMLFEKLVERFPTCGRFWRIYIEQEVVEHESIVLVYNSIGQSEHAHINTMLKLPAIFLHAVNEVCQSVAWLQLGNGVVYTWQAHSTVFLTFHQQMRQQNYEEVEQVSSANCSVAIGVGQSLDSKSLLCRSLRKVHRVTN